MSHTRPAEDVLIDAAAAFGPADHSGIAHTIDVVAVSKKVVEGGGVGESGIFAGRGVAVLLLAI